MAKGYHQRYQKGNKSEQQVSAEHIQRYLDAEYDPAIMEQVLKHNQIKNLVPKPGIPDYELQLAVFKGMLVTTGTYQQIIDASRKAFEEREAERIRQSKDGEK